MAVISVALGLWFNFLGRGRRLCLPHQWRGFLMSVIGRSDPQVTPGAPQVVEWQFSRMAAPSAKSSRANPAIACTSVTLDRFLVVRMVF